MALKMNKHEKVKTASIKITFRLLSEKKKKTLNRKLITKTKSMKKINISLSLSLSFTQSSAKRLMTYLLGRR